MGIAASARRRWYLIVTVAVILLYLFLRRSPTGPNLRGWDVFGVPGQFLNSQDRLSVRTAATFVKRIPTALAGLSYAGAILHPQGLSGLAFVELLYGKPTGPFVDVSESLSDLGVSAKTTGRTAGGVKFGIGHARFHGVERAFAVGRLGRAHVIVVTSYGSPAWPRILAPLVP